MKRALMFLAILTIPLNSFADDCLDELETHIEENWAQSEAAKKEDWQGEPQVNFILTKGKISNIELLKSGDSKQIDKAAIQAVKDANLKTDCISFQGETLYIRTSYVYQDIILTVIPEYERRLPENNYERIAAIKKKKWPQNIKKVVLQKKIQRGMNTEQVRFSWGDPDDINEFVNRFGKQEQWVYGGSYLYFDNGILSSWQQW